MKSKFYFRKISEFIFSIILLHLPVSAYRNNQPVFKVTLGSACYFAVPDSGQFQYGPSFSFNLRLYKKNSLEIEVEQVYWEEEIPVEHYAQRTAVINLQWMRYFSRGFFGFGYVITPSKFYNQDKHTYLIENNMSVGLLGLSGILSFTEKPVALHVKAKFSNSDKFKTGSEFMYYFEASSKLKLLEFLSVSFKYWRWYNTAYYNDMYQSAVTPFFNISWDKFFLDIGPVFSVSFYPSRYKEKFSFHGRIGYELLKRKKKND